MPRLTGALLVCAAACVADPPGLPTVDPPPQRMTTALERLELEGRVVR